MRTKMRNALATGLLRQSHRPLLSARDALTLAELAYGEGRHHDAERLVEIAYTLLDAERDDDTDAL